MLKPASANFTDLCQTQVNLLQKGLGASVSIVYLAENAAEGDNPRLIPIVAYPEESMSWGAEQILSLLGQDSQFVSDREWFLAPNSDSVSQPRSSLLALPASEDSPQKSASEPLQEPASQTLMEAGEMVHADQRIVVPLVHEDVMMGLLVTGRSDRAWSEREQFQIERIAQTIAIACVLDQQSLWLEQELHQQQLMQAQQHDLFHDLLHQFRNPLTALRTFGKLLVKRLNPGDKSRDVAEGIVRESDRLQELLKQFDAAVSWGDTHLLPPSQSDAQEPIRWSASLDASDSRSQAGTSTSPLMLIGSSLPLAEHSIVEVLEPLVLSAHAIAQERGIDLQTFVPQHLPPVNIDAQALQEVLNNLIDNALKYTPSGGIVEIWAGIRQRGRQAIVIADTGPGIPPDDLNRIFERHYRGVQQGSMIPGSGLGLAIARNLVNQMQGEIQVFSPARTSELIAGLTDDWGTVDHPGTAFVVWLPETDETHRSVVTDLVG